VIGEPDDLLRAIEAALFAAEGPMSPAELMSVICTDGLGDARPRLAALYAGRGIELVERGGRWHFQTASDLPICCAAKRKSRVGFPGRRPRRWRSLPITSPSAVPRSRRFAACRRPRARWMCCWRRAGFASRGRRKAPGRPITYGTTDAFLMHFGLEQISDLPGLDELKSAGLFDGRLPKGFGVPQPSDDIALRDDEDPLEDEAPQLLEMEFPEEPEPIEPPEPLNDDED